MDRSRSLHPPSGRYHPVGDRLFLVGGVATIFARGRRSNVDFPMIRVFGRGGADSVIPTDAGGRKLGEDLSGLDDLHKLLGAQRSRHQCNFRIGLRRRTADHRSRHWKAATAKIGRRPPPTRKSPIANSGVPTGRRMKGSEIIHYCILGGSPTADDAQFKVRPAAPPLKRRFQRSSAKVDHRRRYRASELAEAATRR